MHADTNSQTHTELTAHSARMHARTHTCQERHLHRAAVAPIGSLGQTGIHNVTKSITNEAGDEGTSMIFFPAATRRPDWNLARLLLLLLTGKQSLTSRTTPRQPPGPPRQQTTTDSTQARRGAVAILAQAPQSASAAWGAWGTSAWLKAPQLGGSGPRGQ